MDETGIRLRFIWIRCEASAVTKPRSASCATSQLPDRLGHAGAVGEVSDGDPSCDRSRVIRSGRLGETPETDPETDPAPKVQDQSFSEEAFQAVDQGVYSWSQGDLNPRPLA